VETNIIGLKEVLDNDRFDADFYKGIVKPNPKLNYKKIEKILEFVQYGTSKHLNENDEGYDILKIE
jgi:hypothetical protein